MRGRSRAVAAFVLTVLAAATLVGCQAARGTPAGSSGAQGGTQPPAGGGPPVARCGEVRTAAGVPVEVEVQRGPVRCQAALAVEHAYSKALASGKVPGNGGGAPVTIQGWVCQGFDTPQVLATGHASACHKKAAEILAVLPTPSPSP